MKSWLLNLIGKKAVAGAEEKWGLSTGKIGAIVYVLIVAIQTIPAQFGHPITIPDWIFKLLEASGIGLSAWGIRNAVKPS